MSRRRGEAESVLLLTGLKVKLGSRNETNHFYGGLCVLKTKYLVKIYAITQVVPDKLTSLLSKDPPTLPEVLIRRLFKIHIYLLLAAHPQDPYTRDYMEAEVCKVPSQYQ